MFKSCFQGSLPAEIYLSPIFLLWEAGGSIWANIFLSPTMKKKSLKNHLVSPSRTNIFLTTNNWPGINQRLIAGNPNSIVCWLMLFPFLICRQLIRIYLLWSDPNTFLYTINWSNLITKSRYGNQIYLILGIWEGIISYSSETRTLSSVDTCQFVTFGPKTGHNETRTLSSVDTCQFVTFGPKTGHRITHQVKSGCRIHVKFAKRSQTLA